MVDPESALNGDLISSGNEKHSPCDWLRATGHADVATDMGSPLVSRLRDEATSNHTRFDSGPKPLASTHESKATIDDAEATPTRHSIGRP
jgi:hypothetical protein